MFVTHTVQTCLSNMSEYNFFYLNFFLGGGGGVNYQF